MFHCKCRALTQDGVPVYFTVQDVPVRVYADKFVLARRPNSPILELRTVCRMMDHLPLGEGDVVDVQGHQYTVSYYRVFRLVGTSGQLLPSNVVESYKLLSIGTTSCSKLQFRYGECVFQIPSILGCIGDKVVLAGCRVPVDVEAIQVGAGFLRGKRKVFYGDIVDGHEVIMWRGRTCLHKEEGYLDLTNSTLIGGVYDGST